MSAATPPKSWLKQWYGQFKRHGVSLKTMMSLRYHNSVLVCLYHIGARPGVKVSRNASESERRSAGPEISTWSVPVAKLLDFTAGTYVPGSSKLAIFAIVIRQLISHSNFTFLFFYYHKFTMWNVFKQNFTKLKKTRQIMLNTFSRSLIIWQPAIETWAQEMKGPENELGARRAELLLEHLCTAA